MTVSAVGRNDNLSTVATSTAVGAVAGYASKYLLPVTKQEDNVSRRIMINYCRKVINKAKMAEFRSQIAERTPAQDMFIKIAEMHKKDRAFSHTNISKKVKILGGENSAAGKELRSIIRNVDENARSMSKRFTSAYKFTLKKIRPAVPFIVAGAGIGFLTGFIHNVVNNDIG